MIHHHHCWEDGEAHVTWPAELNPGHPMAPCLLWLHREPAPSLSPCEALRRLLLPGDSPAWEAGPAPVVGLRLIWSGVAGWRQGSSVNPHGRNAGDKSSPTQRTIAPHSTGKALSLPPSQTTALPPAEPGPGGLSGEGRRARRWPSHRGVTGVTAQPRENGKAQTQVRLVAVVYTLGLRKVRTHLSLPIPPGVEAPPEVSRVISTSNDPLTWGQTVLLRAAPWRPPGGTLWRGSLLPGNPIP